MCERKRKKENYVKKVNCAICAVMQRIVCNVIAAMLWQRGNECGGGESLDHLTDQMLISVEKAPVEVPR